MKKILFTTVILVLAIASSIHLFSPEAPKTGPFSEEEIIEKFLSQDFSLIDSHQYFESEGEKIYIIYCSIYLESPWYKKLVKRISSAIEKKKYYTPYDNGIFLNGKKYKKLSDVPLDKETYYSLLYDYKVVTEPDIEFIKEHAQFYGYRHPVSTFPSNYSFWKR